MHQKEHLELVYMYIQEMQMVNYICDSCAQSQGYCLWNRYPFQGLSFVVCNYLPGWLRRFLPILYIPIDSVHLWTDSRLVLTWLQDIPTRWNNYIANRLPEIQDITSNFVWHHVPSEDNSADILSRRTDPEELWHSTQWWNRPSSLEQNEDLWPYSNTVTEETPLKQRKHNVCMVNMNVFEEISMKIFFFKTTRESDSLLSPFHRHYKESQEQEMWKFNSWWDRRSLIAMH